MCISIDKKPSTTVATQAPTSKCPVCGILNSGKPSCCAPGGAWFNKCGDPGDSKYDYTRFDGIVACKGKFPHKSPSIVPKLNDFVNSFSL